MIDKNPQSKNDELSPEILEALSNISERLNQLTDSTNKNTPKGRDKWDKLQIIGKLLSSVLIAGIGLLFTLVYNHKEDARIKKMQSAELEIAQLNALVKLAPYITSKEPENKKFATDVLNIMINDEKAVQPTEEMEASEKNDLEIIAQYTKVVLTNSSSILEKKEAVEEIGRYALNWKKSPSVKNEAIEVISNIASSNDLHNDVKEIASNLIVSIRAVQREAIGQEIERQTIDRDIDEIILHHTGLKSGSYEGRNSIESIDEQALERGWHGIGYHYVITGDGIIYTGRSLNERGAHTRGRNNSSIGVAIYLDGNEEFPNENQKKSTGLLLFELCNKFNIEPEKNFSQEKGFHRDYDNKKCPGENLTKEMVLSWISEFST